MNILNNIFLVIVERFVQVILFFYTLAARFFDYPVNPGMPVDKPREISRFFETSTTHLPKYIPPVEISHNPLEWSETVFSKAPPLANIPKFFYQSDTDGFYSFYINLYSNNYFLPDWLSKWLQLTFNICLDTTNLELIQEAIFVFLIIYMKFIVIRINLFWFITINPFIRPWIYITSLVDWAYDITAGIVPGLFGVDIGIIIFFSVVGKLTDVVNSLIFTMPYLPSEGVVDSFIPDDWDSEKVLFFRYLPRLWYTHPIPNQIREFWFHQRPDILNYMIQKYAQLGINFYPNEILKYLSEYNISIEDFNTVYFNNIKNL